MQLPKRRPATQRRNQPPGGAAGPDAAQPAWPAESGSRPRARTRARARRARPRPRARWPIGRPYRHLRRQRHRCRRRRGCAFSDAVRGVEDSADGSIDSSSPFAFLLDGVLHTSVGDAAGLLAPAHLLELPRPAGPVTLATPTHLLASPLSGRSLSACGQAASASTREAWATAARTPSPTCWAASGSLRRTASSCGRS